MSILVYGVTIAPGSDLVLEHLLVDAMVVVGVEVVRFRVRHSLHGITSLQHWDSRHCVGHFDCWKR